MSASREALVAELVARYRSGELARTLVGPDVSDDRLRLAVSSASSALGVDVRREHSEAATEARCGPLLDSEAVEADTLEGSYAGGETPAYLAARTGRPLAGVYDELASTGRYRELRASHVAARETLLVAALLARVASALDADPDLSASELRARVAHRPSDAPTLLAARAARRRVRASTDPGPTPVLHAAVLADLADGLSPAAVAERHSVARTLVYYVRNRARELEAAGGPATDARRADLLRAARALVEREGLAHLPSERVTGELGASPRDLDWLRTVDVGAVIVRNAAAPGRAAPSRGPVHSDADVTASLVEVASRASASPLTIGEYEALRDRARHPSAALVVSRLGWSRALAAAGLPANPSRGGPRSAPDSLASVRSFLAAREGLTTTSGDYLAYARSTPGAASLSTVRNHLGSWSRARAEAAGVGER